MAQPGCCFHQPGYLHYICSGSVLQLKEGQNKLVWGVSCMLPLLPLTFHHSHSHPYPALPLTCIHARILQERAALPSGLTDICPEHLKWSNVLAEDLEKLGGGVSIGQHTYPVWQPWRC